MVSKEGRLAQLNVLRDETLRSEFACACEEVMDTALILEGDINCLFGLSPGVKKVTLKEFERDYAQLLECVKDLELYRFELLRRYENEHP